MKNFLHYIAAVTIALISQSFTVDDITYQPTGNGNCEITNGKYVSGDVVIPETVSDGTTTYTVTSIAKQAFAQNTALTSISIPGTVKAIGRLAFCDDTSLKTVVMAEGVEDIGYSCFCDCPALESVTLPSTITELGSLSPLSGAYGMVFLNCTSLTSISLPANLTTIRETTFKGCSALSSVELPAALTTIESQAFAACTSLTELTLPETVTEIGDGSFQNCRGLRHINIPSGVTKINHSVFLWCSALEEIVIPEGVTEISTQAFTDCYKLREVVVPNSVEHIAKDAFAGCQGIERIDLGTGLKRIGLAALSLWDIDESINYIWNIKEITVRATEPPVYDNESDMDSDFFFAELNFPEDDKTAFLAGITLFVPEQSIDSYRTADQWELFSSIKAIGDIPDDNDVTEILGEYLWTYDSEIGDGGRRNGVVEIDAVQDSKDKVTIAGIYPELTVEASYNSRSKKLSIPNQTVETAGGETLRFIHGVWTQDARIATSEETLVATFKNGAFTFNELDLILVTDDNDGILIAADFNKWGDGVIIYDNWTSMGDADFQDGWIAPSYGINQAENIYKVEMQRNDNDPDIYRLVNPYAPTSGSPVADCNTGSGEGYIMFDISDPDHVLFYPVSCGFGDNRSRHYYLYNTIAYGCYMNDCDVETLVDLMGDQITSTTYKDGLVTLAAGDACFGIDGSIMEGYKWTDQDDQRLDMTAYIWFPGYRDGISSVETDQTAAPEYFNLQGVRITNPQPGQIVIEKRQDRTVKRIFR